MEMGDELKKANDGQDELRAMLSASGYAAPAIEYYIEKKHMGEIAGADHVSELTGTCGDTMAIYLKLDGDVIQDAKYQVMGCAGAVSSAMAVVDLIKGKTLDEARKICDGDVFGLIEDIPAKKHHCVQLSVKTLQQAMTELEA